jgi:hypothetical protein
MENFEVSLGALSLIHFVDNSNLDLNSGFKLRDLTSSSALWLNCRSMKVIWGFHDMGCHNLSSYFHVMNLYCKAPLFLSEFHLDGNLFELNYFFAHSL